MARKSQRSQLLDLFLHVAELLGHTSDRDVAALAGVSADNVANWRTGAVQELKSQTLRAIKAGLAAQVEQLREQASASDGAIARGMVPIEIEQGSGPASLQRQFADRMVYDYLGHRFLYFEPQGALAWERLIREGYAQDCWLAGVEKCIQEWTDLTKEGTGRHRGILAQALGLGRPSGARGLDIIVLGPGEGGKEIIVLDRLLQMQKDARQRLSWLTFALVDVSIPLLFTATKAAKATQLRLRGEDRRSSVILSFCADFEEGSLAFMERMPTAAREDADGVRLVTCLGNVFGNVRDEEKFVRHKLHKMLRPGDLFWLEVGLRPADLNDEPLYAMTQAEYSDTAAFSNRRMLLEGPYRRSLPAVGRHGSDIQTRVWLREGDESCRVPGSINFCHDLVIKNENRVVTMLYSRRYEVDGLTGWLDGRGFKVERISEVKDHDGVPRTVHLLVRRT